MMTLVLMRNPFNTIKEGVPELVWTHYDSLVVDVISEMEYDKSMLNSFRTTFRRYAAGERRSTTMHKIHFALKASLLKVFPIENEKAFFEGNREEMEKEAIATAMRMISHFDDLYRKQKKQIKI